MMYEGLDWPIKTSFRDYVENLRDGIVAAADGAEVEPDTLRFPVGQDIWVSPDGHSGDIGFTGEVRFGGHGGFLVVPFKDPRIVFDQLQGVLSIEYPWAGDGSESRLEIAEVSFGGVDQRDRTWEWRSASVRLTAAGGELFNGSYAEGDELEPLAVSVSKARVLDMRFA